MNRTFEEAAINRPMKPYEFKVDDAHYIFFLPSDNEPTGDDFCLYRVVPEEEATARFVSIQEKPHPVQWVGNGPEYQSIAALLQDLSEGTAVVIPTE